MRTLLSFLVVFAMLGLVGCKDDAAPTESDADAAMHKSLQGTAPAGVKPHVRTYQEIQAEAQAKAGQGK